MNSPRFRYSLAGLSLAVAFIWIAGWALSHWLDALSPVFGTTGWLPVPLAIVPALIGAWLLTRPIRPGREQFRLPR
jgi:hypothetical protein